MLRRPQSVPVARIGRSVPESRCAAPSGTRLLLQILAGAALGAQAVQGWAAGPATPKLPIPCVGAVCGTSGRALNFIQGASRILPGYPGQSTAVSTRTSADGKALTVTQYADNVILNWASFNVGAGNSVQFLQPSANSAALNRIYQGNASEIAGKISANGQIYLLNQNGILFHQGAQIQVGGLLASSLSINDSDFLNSIFSPWQNGLPLLQRGTHVDASGATVADAAGDVRVDAGATLETLAGASGRIVLAAPTVENAGLIHSPGGQTILAAGDKIYLNASDPGNQDLRGLVVAIDNGGLARNLGSVLAEKGNITIAGASVNQLGKLSATTSVSLNGSIYLKAGDGAKFGANLSTAPVNGGQLTLGAGSVTEVRPDLADATTAVDAQAQGRSTILLEGLNVHLAGTIPAVAGATPGDPGTPAVAGALVAAPGGSITVTARANLIDGAGATGVTLDASGKALNGAGTIVIDDGAQLDVSGTANVVLPVSRNFVQAELRGNELQDSPSQRNGFLYTKTVTVDVRTVDANGNLPIANIKGYVAGIGRTVAERTAAGGDITLDAGSTVLLRQGARVNLSGGWLSYQDSRVGATQLLDAFGRRYDLATAPKDRTYVGFADSYTRASNKWGSSTSWHAPAPLVKGYLEGRNAGSLAVFATQTVLDGQVLASTQRGPNQRFLSAPLDPKDPANWAQSNGVPAAPANLDAQYFQQAPLGGLLQLGSSSALRNRDVLLTHDLAAFDAGSSYSYERVLSEGVTPERALTTSVDLARMITDGVSRYAITALNRIDIAANADATGAATPYALAAGGQLDLSANELHDHADLSAHGGLISLRAVQPAANNPQATLVDGLPTLVLDDHVVLDTSGAWVNDSASQAHPDLASLRATSAGNVTLSSDGSLNPGAGSVIDVSGGAYLNSSNALSAGAAGTISLTFGSPFGSGRLSQLGLHGEGFAKGGTLKIKAPAIRIGAGTVANGELLVDPGQFASGGFASYSLTATSTLLVDGGTALLARADNRVLQVSDRLLASGTPISAVGQLGLVDASLRNNPVRIALNAGTGGNPDARLQVATGALISTDPGGSIALSSQGSLYVDGTLSAPSGSIALTTDIGDTRADFQSTQSLWLGSHARLDAHETSRVLTDANGFRKGGLINDGANAVTLNAARGLLVAEAGAQIDVSGTSTTVDLADNAAGTRRPVLLAGSAGTVTLTASDAIAFDAQIQARAGGPGGQGGTLNVTLDQSIGYGDGTQVIPPYATTDRIVLSASAGLAQTAGRVRGAGITAQDPLYGSATLNTGLLQASGIDALALRARNQIEFHDRAALDLGRSLTLDAPLLLGQADTAASLRAPVISVRNVGGHRPTQPVEGLGSLNLTAGGHAIDAQGHPVDSLGQFDITGDVALGGFAQTTLASFGDLRLNGGLGRNNAFAGSLQATGALTLDAVQIYPSTLTDFTVQVYARTAQDPATAPTTLTIAHTSTLATPVPLSAAGHLTLKAPIIQQNGTLRAPFGRLDLIASSAGGGSGAGSLTLGAQSLTSTSGAGVTVPFGNTSNGGNWYYPFDTTIDPITGAPAKSVHLNGDHALVVASGANIDLAGGGDLLAYESVIGPGGSKDILSGPDIYAILPNSAYAHSYAPTDPGYLATEAKAASDRVNAGQAAGTPLKVGDAVDLQMPLGGLFAAGTYTLLPAHYALLPGAYAVRLVSANDPLPGTSSPQVGGSFLVAGKKAVLGTDVQQARWSTWQVLPSATVHAASELDVSTANAYFHNLASAAATPMPVLAADGGQLVLQAGASLDLQTTRFNFSGASYALLDSKGQPLLVAGQAQSAQGRGGEVDLAADHIAIVSQVNAHDAELTDTASGAPYLQVTAATLNALSAERVVIGGSVDATTGVLSTSTSKLIVKLANGGVATTLAAPDLILAARQSLTIDSGSTLAASSSPSAAQPQALSTLGDGALVRLTDGALPGLARSAGTGARAELTIQSGVSLQTGSTAAPQGSLTLDSAGTVKLDPATTLRTAALRVDASSINLGADAAAQAAAGGVTLQDSTLAQAGELYLQTPGAIRLYGTTQVGTATPLTRLTLDAGALEAIGAGERTLQANAVVLRASQSSAAETVSGSGTLTVHAVSLADGSQGSLELGPGSQQIVGSSATHLVADQRVTTRGAGSLSNQSALTVSAPLVAVAAGSQFTLSSAAALTLDGGQASAPASTAGAGGRLALQGQSVRIDTAVRAQSGRLDVHASGAQGAVSLGSHALLDASAFSKTFRGATADADAGAVNLVSESGNVELQAGSRVDVSASGSAHAGSVTLSAAQGTVTLVGSLSGSADAGQQGGSLAIDELQLADVTAAASPAAARALRDAALSQFDQVQQAGGFAESYALRVRQGDLDLPAGTALAAHTLSFQADHGTLSVAGTLSVDADSRHMDAGSLALWAGQDLDLAASARLSASSSSGAAGRISLGLATTSSGALHLDHPTLVFDAAAGQAGGTLALRLPQGSDASGTPVLPIAAAAAATVTASQAAPSVTVEAVKAYSTPVAAVDQAFFDSTVAPDMALLQGQAPAIIAALNLGLPAGSATPQLLAGVELTQSASSATTLGSAGSTIDLSGLRAGGAAGVLTVRSAGDLTVAGTLGDGFDASGKALSGSSWSYRLVAGADLAAADPLSTQRDTRAGALRLDPGALLRTGTGSIALAAAGDIRFGRDVANNLSASVYTAGQLSPFPASLAPFAAGSYFKAPSGLVRQYTWQGGDVTIAAGGDVQGSDSSQVVNSWLYRSASFLGSNFASLTGGRAGVFDQTTWWVAFDQFHMDAGALGGGNLQVQAGGNIVDFSAAIPTNGRLGGGTVRNPGFSLANLAVRGGGNLDVQAAGNIIGGSYYVEQGSGLLRAGGGILASRQAATPFSTVLALGSAQVTLEAGGNIDLQAAYNPFLAPQSYPNLELPLLGPQDPTTPDRNARHVIYFSTFSDASSLHMLSSGGDVSLGRGLNFAVSHAVDPLNPAATPPVLINNQQFVDTDPLPALQVLPASVRLAALGGSVAMPEGLTLSPSATGNLTLLAGQNVDLRSDTSGGVALTLADFSTSALPNAASVLRVPSNGSGGSQIGNLYATGSADGATGLLHATSPLHAGDSTPVLIAADQGSVLGNPGGVSGTVIVSGKPVVVEAGQDIIGVSVVAQHLTASDVSRLDAGRDIIFTPPGTQASANDLTTVEVDGPGMLQLRAGRNLDLGTSLGVRTNQSVYQSSSDAGASVSLYAGLGACAGGACTPSYQAFAASYIDPAQAISRSDGNDQLLVAYVNRLRGTRYSGKSAGDIARAWSDFKTLSADQQAGLVEQVLSNEIHIVADRHGSHLANDTRDYEAFGTLFQGAVIDGLTGQAIDASHTAAVYDPASLSAAQRAALALRTGTAPASGTYGEGIAKNIALTPAIQLATVLAYPGSPLAQAILKANPAVQGFLDANPDLAAKGFGPNVVQRQALGLSDAPAVYTQALIDQGLALAGADARVAKFGTGPTLASTFVEPAHRGDISLVYSQVRTLGAGDIGLYAPAGGVNVGLANSPPGAVVKGADKLGVVTQASGAIRGAVLNDVNVNASRVFTVGGGDLSLWSGLGNIDAGKGAKTTVVVPPPKVVIDPTNGQVTIIQSGATNGSGIATLKTAADQAAGYVDLIAPFGVIDAGDAGVRSAGAINVDASRVVNSSNIAASGPSSGVPSDAPPPPVAAPASSSTKEASASSDSTNKRLAEAAEASDKLKTSFKPTIVTVDVVSGDEDSDEKEKRKSAPKR